MYNPIKAQQPNRCLKNCLCTLFIMFAFGIIGIGFIYDTVGIAYASLALADVTYSEARICLILVLIAYICGLISSALLICVERTRAQHKKALGIAGLVSYIINAAFTICVLVYSHRVYYSEKKPTYCGGVECGYNYTVAMMGFIITTYLSMIFVLIGSILLLLICVEKRKEQPLSSHV